MLENAADDSLCQQGHVEVYEQADFFASQVEVGHQLGFVYREDMLYRL